MNWPGQLHQAVQQSLGSVKEIKVLGRAKFFEQAFDRPRAGLSNIEVHRSAMEMAPRMIVETLFMSGVIALILIAQLLWVDAGDLVPVIGVFA